MGIEKSPDVEESTASSLRSSSDGHQELPGSLLDHSTATLRRLDAEEKGFVTPSELDLKDESVISTRSDHHQDWEELYLYAHTFAITELSLALGVDLQ